MAEVIDIQKICRCCLVDTGPFTSLLSDAYPESIAYSELFNYCTSIQITETDKMPVLMCETCIDLLKKLFFFKQMALKSNAVLKQHLLTESQKRKEEPLQKCYTGTMPVEVVCKELNTEESTEEEHKTGHEGTCEETSGNVAPFIDILSQPISERQLELDMSMDWPSAEDIITLSICVNFCDLNKAKMKSKVTIKTQNKEILLSLSTFLYCKKFDYSVMKPRKRAMRNRNLMQCPKCSRCFQIYENFEAHMRNHFGKTPDIKCSICDKSFQSLRNLRSHYRIHNGVKKYQCPTCGKSFAYLHVLKNHELTHSGVKKHACHLCDAKFVQAYNLKTHIETHSNQKNFICAQCGKKFSQPGNLKIHLIRHSGIKNHACTVCDMKFYVKSELFKHMQSHSTDKPFSCEYCDKSFKTKSFKTIHLRTHTGERPYECEVCSKRFMARKDLRNHRMIHTGEKPHKCTLCSQAFIQKCALNRHMKCHNSDGELKRLLSMECVIGIDE